VYYYQAKYDKVISYYTDAYRLYAKISDVNGMGAALMNLAGVHLAIGQYENAIAKYLEAIPLLEKAEQKQGLAGLYANVGYIYGNLGQTEKALIYLRKSLVVFEEMKDRVSLANTHYLMGTVFIQQKKINLALELDKMTGTLPGLKEEYKGLAYCDSVQGNWKSAFENYRLFKLYTDSLFNNESSKITAELNTKFETQKKESQIALMKSESDKKELLRKEEQQKSRWIIFTVAGFLCLMSIFGVLMYRRWKVTQKQNIVIEHQKQLVEEKQKEILDSIFYASRIQRALVTSERYIEKALNKFKSQQK
jgi:tetratricopeptide (TPR) repeat protein